MRALLFSNYPDPYLQKAILPKLRKRGVEVLKTIRPKNAAPEMKIDADAILFMHELASHRDNQVIREMADRTSVPLIYLSRKSSMWGDRLPAERQASEPRTAEVPAPEHPAMAACETAPKSAPEAAPSCAEKKMPSSQIRLVPDEVLSDMLAHMIKLHAAGAKYSDMVPELRKYWKHGSLESGEQLRSYLTNILRRPDCPDFYKRWVADRRENMEKKTNPEKTSSAKLGSPAVLDHEGRIVQAPKEAHKPRLMKSLSDRDLGRLSKAVMDLRSAGKSYREILPLVRGFWPSAKDAPDSADQLAKLASSIAASPRAPLEFREWYLGSRTRPGKPAVEVEDEELARIYASENADLKSKNAELEAKNAELTAELAEARGASAAARMRTELFDLFASCRSLAKLGAIGPDEAIGMAVRYLEKLESTVRDEQLLGSIQKTSR